MPVKTPLAGFTSDSNDAEGSTPLIVELGTWPHVRKIDMEFVVVSLDVHIT